MLRLKYASRSKSVLFHGAIAIGVVVWSIFMAGLYLWTAEDERVHYDQSVILKAESLARHIQSLRGWIGGHGGVYVEIDDAIQPNLLLSHVPERDIATPSGRKFTLLNSPAVLRQLFQEFDGTGGDRIRLVSRHPMNAANTPDAWEAEGLDALEAGADEIQGFVMRDGQSVLRLLQPMKLEGNCLSCHHYPDDPPARVVGALSITVDKTPYDKLYAQVMRSISMGYGSIWIAGVSGLLLFDVIGGRLLKRIEQTATHDGLTQLLNRSEIMRLLGQEGARASRYQHALCVMMVDIDHFKRINDAHGHQMGDEVLRCVAQTIEQTIRRTDMAGRYGGEEFLIVTPQTSIDEAALLARRIHAAIKSMSVPCGDKAPIAVTVSVGVSGYSPATENLESLVSRADAALYQAKAAGRDRVCLAA